MIKLTYCLRRLPHLTREEFQEYWLHNHAPLVRKHAGTVRLKRYVQVHTMTETMFNEAAERMRKERGGLEAFDGVAELWWESADDIAIGYATPEGQRVTEILYEDEKKFIDLKKSSVWFGEEHTIFER